jgi:hypothetical protein
MRQSRFGELGETQKRGQATEAILKSEFVVRDIPILVPEYDNEPYDFVIHVGDSFLRIQAKTAYGQSDATVQFETLSTRIRSDGYDRQGYEGKIDYFAVYNPALDEVYLVSIEEAATGKMEIRHEAPENNQWDRINWHEDFLLDNRLSEVRGG